MRVSKRCTEAALDFLAALLPGTTPKQFHTDPTPLQRACYPLVQAAFHLYEKEWNSEPRDQGYDIRDWKWPAEQLREPEPFADGRDEVTPPWDVLLRAAYATCHWGGIRSMWL